jgi:hypothetical protein
VQVLTWSADQTLSFQVGRTGQTQTATFNPTTGAITTFTVTNTKHDMFCPGIATTGSGDIVVTGGDTAEKSTVYMQAKGTWVATVDMNVPRGYQGSTALANGQVRGRAARGVAVSRQAGGARARAPGLRCSAPASGPLCCCFSRRPAPCQRAEQPKDAPDA